MRGGGRYHNSVKTGIFKKSVIRVSIAHFTCHVLRMNNACDHIATHTEKTTSILFLSSALLKLAWQKTTLKCLLKMALSTHLETELLTL